MSDEVFVQVDNKNNGKFMIGLTVSAVIGIGSVGMILGQFGQRVSTLEHEMDTRAPTSEVKLGFENLQLQLSQLQIQISDIQRTLQSSSSTRSR